MLNYTFLGIKLWVLGSVLIILGLSTFLILRKSKENFSSQTPANKIEEPIIGNKVMTVYNFNTKSCGWSQKFQPEWDRFTELAKTDPTLSNIIVKDVKCDDKSNGEICANPKFNVPGFPYVVVEVGENVMPYDGERTAESIISFINGIQAKN
jgi:hypothetical protein